MIPSSQLVEFVKGWESCRLKAYKDGGGIWTCGWGATGEDIDERTEWTQDRADAELSMDIDDAARGLRKYMKRIPTQQQFDALVSLAYNAGVKAIGVSGLMLRFNDGHDNLCADRFLLWDKADGVEVNGLHKRRIAERAIYLKGDYSGRP